MQLDKNKYNIYLVSAILFTFIIFMSASVYFVVKNVTSSSSSEILKAQENKRGQS
jgi:hypothetical protein